MKTVVHMPKRGNSKDAGKEAHVTTISRHLSRSLPFTVTVVKVRRIVFFFLTQTTNRKREYFKLCFFCFSQLEINIEPISTLMTETFASTGKKKTVNGGCRKLFRHRLFWELFFTCISLYAFANINKNA